MRRRTLPWIAAALALAFTGWFWFARSSRPEALALVVEAVESPSRAMSALEGTSQAASATYRTSVAPSNVAQDAPMSASIDEAPPARGTDDLLRGKVVDDLGAPVAGCEVSLVFTDPFAELGRRDSRVPFAMFERDASRQSTTTAEDGGFAISRGPGDALIARRAAGLRSDAFRVSERDRGPYVLVIPRPARITGVVRAAAAAVEGADVVLQFARGDGWGAFSSADDRAPMRTSTDGRFVIDDAQPGDFALYASRAGFGESERVRVSVLPGATAEVILTLAAAGRIRGRVDPSQGEVAGRRVDLFPIDGGRGKRDTTTDAHGDFVIEDVVPQRYVLELHAVDVSDVAQDQQGGLRKLIDVVAGQTREVSLGGHRDPIRVTGRVTRAGLPMAALAVRAHSKNGGDERTGASSTDEDGRFELDVDEPGAYQFVVRDVRGSSARFDRIVDRASAGPFSFELPSGSVTGIVLAPNGEPLDFVMLTLQCVSDGPANDPTMSRPRIRRAQSDEKGRFKFEFVVSGDYVLRAPDEPVVLGLPSMHAQFGGVLVEGLRVDEAPLRPLMLQLVVGGSVRGRVVDASGAAVAEAAIQVFDAAGVALRASNVATSGNGVFEVVSLAPGEYSVVAHLGERRGTSAVVRVVAGEIAEASIELPR